MKNCDFLHDSARGVDPGFERPELRTRRFPHCDHFMARWMVASRYALFALIACRLGSFSEARAESVLLSGATVHTISGETLSPGNVLVKDGKIAAVGSNVSGDGAPKIDLSGQHLFPGLIALN